MDKTRHMNDSFLKSQKNFFKKFTPKNPINRKKGISNRLKCVPIERRALSEKDSYFKSHLPRIKNIPVKNREKTTYKGLVIGLGRFKILFLSFLTKSPKTTIEKINSLPMFV